LIYLDHNATTPLSAQVLQAMMPYLRECWGNPSSPYRFGGEARAAVEEARARIARCAGCKPSEIVFTASGTESDNLAVRGVARASRSRGRHIVTTAIEHHAVLKTCEALAEEGYQVTYLPVTPAGVVDLSTLAESLTPETVLVTVMHANNETGVLQPVEEIGRLVHRHGILLHVDAVQTAGKFPHRFADIGADLVSFSGHKFYGPKGSAGLYVREGTPLSPLLTGGAHEMGLRAGTENVAGIVGLAEALDLALYSSQEEGRRLRRLRDRFESLVRGTAPSAKFNGASAERVPNTSSISFKDVDGESVVLALDLKGICASTGSACSTGEPEPSHVLLAMGLSPREAQGTVRVSLGRDTQEEDIEATAKALAEVVERLRALSSA